MKRQISVYLNENVLKKIEDARGRTERATFISFYLTDHIDSMINVTKISGPKELVTLRVNEDVYKKLETVRGAIPRSTYLECLFEGI